MTKQNFMRYDCGANAENCFNRRKRLKFHMLDVAMPRNIGFSDIDAFSELNGYCCFIEWKDFGAELDTAQRLAYTKLTKDAPKNIVFDVRGDAEHMTVDEWRIIYMGKIGNWNKGPLETLLSQIESWGMMAEHRAICRKAVTNWEEYKTLPPGWKPH